MVRLVIAVNDIQYAVEDRYIKVGTVQIENMHYNIIVLLRPDIKAVIFKIFWGYIHQTI